MKPLSKKSRNISILILGVIFLIVGPLLIAYSEGYRIGDIDDVLKLVKTGGIYVHSNDISNTSVYLNGEFVKSSGLFLRNTFVQNLRPGSNYVIDVSKEGYNSYIKDLTVYPSLVTEVTIMMLPKEIEKREILKFLDESDSKNVATSTNVLPKNNLKINQEYQDLMVTFDLASSTKELSAYQKTLKIATTTVSNKLSNTSSTSKKILNSTNTSSTTDLKIKNIPDYFVKLGVEDPDKLKNLITTGNEVSWLKEGNIILNWIGKQDNIPYYYCLKNLCKDKIILDWQDEIKRFDFLPTRNDVFVVLVNSGVWAVEVDDRSDRNIQPIYLGKNLDFRINSNNRIVIKDGDKFFELRF